MWGGTSHNRALFSLAKYPGPGWMGECMESVIYHIIYIYTGLVS